MRYIAFVATLVAYMTIHMMRMSLSFVQPDLIKYFGIEKSEIGLAMSSTYIIMGISYLIRSIVPLKKLQTTYLVTVGLTALSYSLTALAKNLQIQEVWILFVSLALFGLFQSSTWPILIKITHKYFKIGEDGFMLGLWSSTGEIGNAFGFLCFTIIEFYLKFDWTINIYFCAAVTLLLAVIIFLLPVQNPEELEENLEGENHCQEFCTNFQKIIKDIELSLSFVLYCTLKALIYGVLLWMPTYFAEGGFGDFKGYILVTMNLFGIAGSILSGLVFEKVSRPIMREIILMVSQFAMAASFYCIIRIQLDAENKWVFLLLIALIGLTLLGNFNAIGVHSAMLIAEERGVNLGYLTSLLMTFGNTSVGVLQIIIGFVVTKQEGAIFLMFFGLSLVILLIFAIRGYFIWKQSQQKQVSHHSDSDEDSIQE